MKKFKKLMLVGMMALVLIGVQATSHALTLGFYDFNGNFLLVADGGPMILSGGITPDGIVTYSGPVGSNWSVNVTTGISKPLIGSAEMPQIRLKFCKYDFARSGASKIRDS